ncbi:MAG: proliferating cell nuclear antigen (pcna) [Candidatus Hadarchaeia archaeon]
MKNSGVWKNCIGAISNLVEEIDFEFTEEGVEMRAMDPSHVALSEFKLSSNAFEEYELEGPQKLGVDLGEMDRFLSRAKKNDEFTLSFDESEGRLKLKFRGESTRRFSLPLLEVEEEDLPEPDLDFTAFAKISAGAISEGLKDAALVGDNVRFELLEDKFLMGIESDTGSVEMELSEEDGGLKELDVDEPSRSMYNIGYLDDMFKAASSSDLVEIHHGTDLPILMIFNIADGNGKLKFLLAPRIETE